VLALSALQGKGVKAVQDWMVKQLPEGPTLYPKHLASEHNERFFVAEIIREQVFRQFDEEVPYAVQVMLQETRFIGHFSLLPVYVVGHLVSVQSKCSSQLLRCLKTDNARCSSHFVKLGK
jgi:hypothetical protein